MGLIKTGNMYWDELKWYKADKDYSFELVKALVKEKNGNTVVRGNVKKGLYYIPLPLIDKLPKEDE